jgi:hypothetical protein
VFPDVMRNSRDLGRELGVAYSGVNVTVLRSTSNLKSWRVFEDVVLSSTDSTR